MSVEFKGFVAKLSEKTGQGRNGPWAAYSAKIEKKDGTEYDKWVSFGFESPGIKEGDYISVEANEENGRMQADLDTLKVSKNPPARAQKQRPAGDGGGFRGKGGGYKADGTGIQNRTNPEDAKRMTFANARTSAIELIAVLLEHDALPASKAATKTGQASRFEEVNAAVDKLTVRFYNDSLSLRLLETVADTVVDTKADGALPETEGDTASDNRTTRSGVQSGDADDDFEDETDDEDFQ